jgi:2'-5' RNA ligase
MRLFVGIALANDLTAELAQLCNRLQADGDRLRWSAAEGWHITLQFLGNADAEQFDCLKASLSGVRSLAVPVRLGGLAVFDRAGAFVIEVVTSPELLALQQRVLEATTKCDFVPEQRPYHPHITLARAKGDARRQLQNLKTQIKRAPLLPSFTSKEFLLYESHLGPGGSKYVVQA